MNKIVEKIFDETAGRADRGIPCLIGPPQNGKTHSVLWWSEKNGYKVVRLLAQTMEPEAITGYDVKHPTLPGILVHANPDWFRIIMENPKQKWVIFMDELDKAREASQTSVLTLLCDRMIQNKKLPDTVAIFCAMNEPRSPLPPALVERLLFIPFPGKNDDLTKGLKVFRSIAKEYLETPKIQFPEKKKNKGTLHRLESWQNCPDFWADEDLRHTIVVGLVPVKDVAWMMGKLDPKAFMGLDLSNWATNARPSDIKNSLIDLLNSEKDQQKRYDVLKILSDRANADPSGEVAQVLSQVAERLHEVKA